MNYDKVQSKIDKIEREIHGQLSEHHDKIQLILEAIKQLIAPPPRVRRRIGFKRNENA